jgi:hypothetical protein
MFHDFPGGRFQMQRYAWHACMVAIVFAIVFGFVPILPWGGCLLIRRWPIWRLFQMTIILGVSAWIVSLAPPGEHAGMAPFMFGLFAAYIATLVLSKLVDFFRWLGRLGSAPARSLSLHDQASNGASRTPDHSLLAPEVLKPRLTQRRVARGVLD